MNNIFSKIGIQSEGEEDPATCEDFEQRIEQISNNSPEEYMHLFHIRNLRKIPNLKDLNSGLSFQDQQE